MSQIPDDKLFSFSDRVKGKVVIITGAANGIGKETALRFAEHGAKVVIGDLDITGATKVVAEIEKAGGSAVCIKCNVTRFEEQVEMFELAMQKYGSVDIVVPNAGVPEIGSFQKLEFKDGKPIKPTMTTIEVNLFGVLYTAHLALHYLELNKKEGDLKSLIMIGSMASWAGIPMGEMYAGSKHAVLGVMRSLHPIVDPKGIRVGCIHPFFADTAIVSVPVKLLLAGIPFTPVSRIAGAIFYAATDADMASSGSAWLLTDDGPVFMVPKEEFKMGVYKMIDDRANAVTAALNGITRWALFFRDIWHITGKPIVSAGLAAGLAKILWDNRESIEQYVRVTILS
jgi:NAD(P)-dependent dehydrogenase (short-subunit alcohol dehydrogenase family)